MPATSRTQRGPLAARALGGSRRGPYRARVERRQLTSDLIAIHDLLLKLMIGEWRIVSRKVLGHGERALVGAARRARALGAQRAVQHRRHLSCARLGLLPVGIAGRCRGGGGRRPRMTNTATGSLLGAGPPHQCAGPADGGGRFGEGRASALAGGHHVSTGPDPGGLRALPIPAPVARRGGAAGHRSARTQHAGPRRGGVRLRRRHPIKTASVTQVSSCMASPPARR